VLDAINLDVANGAEPEGGVGLDDGEGGDGTDQGLSRVEGEGLLGEPDLAVGVPELGLTGVIEHGLVVLIHHDGVLDDAVLAGGNDDVLGGANDHLLVVLAHKGPGADLEAGDVGVLVQDMEVVVRRNPHKAGNWVKERKKRKEKKKRERSLDFRKSRGAGAGAGARQEKEEGRRTRTRTRE